MPQTHNIMSEREDLAARLSASVESVDGEFAVGTLIGEFVAPLTRTPAGDAASITAKFDEFVSPLTSAGVDHPDDLADWYLAQGFGEGAPSEVGFEHSNLGWVIESHRGIPITLALLLMESGRRIGMSCRGINFPGHFLVALEDVVFDPLRLAQVDMEELAEPQRDDALWQTATPLAIALRMLNNVKALHLARQGWVAALEVVDLQLAVAARTGSGIVAGDAELASSLHFERGEFWQQLGAFAAAREAFLACAASCPYPELAAKATERAEALDGRGETLH